MGPEELIPTVNPALYNEAYIVDIAIIIIINIKSGRDIALYCLNSIFEQCVLPFSSLVEITVAVRIGGCIIGPVIIPDMGILV